MSDEYICTMCHETFIKCQSDEEVMTEARELFGAGIEMKDCDSVCDDCFKKIDPRQFGVAKKEVPGE